MTPDTQRSAVERVIQRLEAIRQKPKSEAEEAILGPHYRSITEMTDAARAEHASLLAENARLKGALQGARIKRHRGCEDGFYACPKHEDWFSAGHHDEIEKLPLDERECWCGMDTHNARLDAALDGASPR